MISQVADKTMIEQAYNAGVEFYINKPINVIEAVSYTHLDVYKRQHA